MKTKLALLFPALLALTLAPAGAAVRYVNLANPSPAPPYTNWASAAKNIQAAIDVADVGDEIMVTNGVYRIGGRVMDGVMNRVAATNALTVRSVNGPAVTLIDGGAAVRCSFRDERWISSKLLTQTFFLIIRNKTLCICYSVDPERSTSSFSFSPIPQDYSYCSVNVALSLIINRTRLQLFWKCLYCFTTRYFTQ